MLSITNSKLIILVFLFSSCFLSYSQITKENKNSNISIKDSKDLLISKNTGFLENTHRDFSKNNLPYFLENYTVNGSSVPTFKLKNIFYKNRKYNK